MKRRLTIYITGLAITALGIALIVRSIVGAGPWDSVAVGLKLHFGLTIGMWSIISQVFLILFTAVIEKARIRIESVLVIVVRSWFLDFWYYIALANLDASNSLALQWFIFALGVFTIGVGISIYMEAKFPSSPIDGLMIALSERFNLSISTSRLFIEASGLIIGYLFGGPVGVGTIIVALTLGRIIQTSNRLLRKYLLKPQISH
ncbi:YczE/YyaS/YitT family protein [Peribacillus frigoritolerans]|uniref:YczE/YyaS/YitT family protein n=1 Tax=Peribacillus frigoritolerans TaxID=450367 RepID=UPI0020BF76C5|nr:BCR, YitT family protein [Peribacillus frigoritolerans]